MTDYISREEAIKRCTFGRTSLGLISELRSIPAADVRPVVRGHWIPVPNPDDIPCRVTCSSCTWFQYWCSPFCPNCGADMRGGAENDRVLRG